MEQIVKNILKWALGIRGAMLVVMMMAAQPVIAGTWTPLVHKAPGSIGLMMLMSDGTVMAKSSSGGGDGYGNIWYRLTPDSTGSYVNGTWAAMTPMHDTRLYTSSQVLTDGRLFVAGGEYGTGHKTGETYDPLANAWTYAPYSGHTFSDSNSEILQNGRVIIGPVESSQTGTIFFNPFANSWITGPTAKGSYNESAWVKLPDNSILYVNKGSTNSERYIPASNTWITDATVPVSLYDTFGDECGPGMLLPNGNVVMFGSTGHTAIYTPSGSTANGSWVAGPDIPNGQGMPDAPCAMEPNGNILLAVCPIPISGSEFQSPTTFYEYNYLTNSFTSVATPTGGTMNYASYYGTMLTLPDGTVIYSNFGTQVYSYQGGGTPVASGQPTITSIAQNSDASYLLTGTLLNGINEGSAYGDDNQEATNYPIVRLTSGTTVYYARTYNWSSTGVMTGSTPETTQFVVPSNLPAGVYSLVVVANGISSSATPFYYAGAGALAATPSILSQPEGQVADSGVNVTFSVTATGSGLSYQWLLNGATPPNATGANTATLTVPAGAANLGAYSVTVSNAQGAATSNQAVLSVNTAPVITQGPDNLAITSGSTATLTVTATLSPGAGSQTYQWYQGTAGTTATPVGSNSSSFTTPALTTATSYWVQVSNGDLSVNSGTATVSISGSALPNLKFFQPSGWSSDVVVANATNITIDSPVLRTSDTLFVNFAPLNSGTVAVASAWNIEVLVDGAVTLNIAGSATLGPNVFSSITNRNIGSLAAGTHTIQVILDSGNTVTEVDESDNSFTKTITVYPASTAAPAISGQPSGATIGSGQSKTLTVTPGASGTSSSTLTYQWYRGATGDTTIPVGLNQTSYATPDLTTTTSYWVQVTNSANISTSSSTATVTVTPAVLPNLAFTQPTGWSAPVVVAASAGATTDPSSLPSGTTLYVNFALTNNGTAAIGSAWSAAVYLDNVLQGTVPFSAGLAVSGVTTGSVSISPPTVGPHTVQVVLNSGGGLLETFVSDDVFTKAINIQATVTNLNDSGAGSLRQTITSAISGTVISFASNLSGGTIILTPAARSRVPGSGLTIDASQLAGGITVSGGTGTKRLFTVAAGTTLSLNYLTLAAGHGGGVTANGSGGAIYNAGTLQLNACTFNGNSSTVAGSQGGAIESTGAGSSTTALNCIFSGNSDTGGSNGGGAICADTSTQLTCTNCTFSGNTSTTAGGALRCTSATVTLTSSTLAANSCTGNGGAIDVQTSGTLTASQCTISGNTCATGRRDQRGFGDAHAAKQHRRRQYRDHRTGYQSGERRDARPRRCERHRR